MNTLNDPLKITFNGEYKVNKPNDQTGEYIDVSIGSDLVGGINAVLAIFEIEKKLSGGKVDLNDKAWDNLINDLKSISHRALGG